MLTFELQSVLRRLRAHPMVTALNVVVLGVGLGAFLFLLSIVNGLIVQPLPFPRADQLVGIGYQREGNVGIGIMGMADYTLLKGELGALTLAADSASNVFVDRGGGATRYSGAFLSANMLGLLGATPLLGRTFAPDDERPGAQQVVLLSEQIWRQEFGSDSSIVGKTVRVNAEPTVVIGVLGGGFAFPTESRVWLPLRPNQSDLDLSVVGVLPAGTSLDGGRQALATAAAALGAKLEGQRSEQELILKPLKYRFVSEATRKYVWLMLAASFLVLLLACANSVNLQLGQVLNRRAELAVYSALGSGSRRLLRESLLECLVLTVMASGIGLGAVQLGTRWIVSTFAANDSPPAYFFQLGLNARMIALSVVVALGTALIAGLSPALWASRADGALVLRDGQKGSTGRGFARVANVLVIAEIALTIVLLVGAGTFIESLQHMSDFDTGVRAPPQRILTAQLEYDFGAPDGPDTVVNDRQFLDRLAARLNAEPRLVGATLSDTVPGAQLGSHEYIGALGAAMPPGGYAKAQFGVVDRYFAKTYDLDIVAGRFFDETDAPDSHEKSVVVNQALADRLWPGQSALGQRLVFNPQRNGATALSVIGVVRSLHLESPLEPRLPAALVVSGQYRISPTVLAVQVRGDADSFIPDLTRLVRAERGDVALFDWRTLDALVAARRSSLAVVAKVFLAVGVLGLLLAATGIYGVLSFAVTQRTREIGIRRAVGAGSMKIIRAVGGRLSVQVLTGLGIGLALALPWSVLLAKSLMQSQLFDPLIVLGTALLVLTSATVACSVPLARALRVDPMIALRLE